MIVVGVVGFALQTNWRPALHAAGDRARERPFQRRSRDRAAVSADGDLCTMAGFSEEIYAAVPAFFGHRRGGLAYATIGGSAAFGVMCGSSTATAATFTKVALPEMLKRGYSPAFSTGTIAAGGTLKSLIPPSIVMVLYCIATKTFIFDLFTAAVSSGAAGDCVEPGRDRGGGSTEAGSAPVSERTPWPERRAALRKGVASACSHHRRVRRALQRHLHGQRGRVGRRGPVLPVRNRCAAVSWVVLFLRLARGRERDRRCCISS